MQAEGIIRDYKSHDRASVLNLLRLNTPKYFAPQEEADFIHYLENELEYYFVIEIDGRIIACGGFNFSGNPAIGKISWDILHPDFQGKSYGTLLLNYRIERLNQFSEIEKITVRTSQLAYRFYEKNGFIIVDIVQDYWAEGFHLYSMELTH